MSAGPRRLLAAPLLLVATAAVAAGAAPPQGRLCEQGQRQSPIDIRGPLQAAQQALQVHYRVAPLQLVNDGHTVRARVPAGSGLTLGGQRMALSQFHFHWPGGDRLQGEDFPLSMHFLHKSAAGQLVSLVVLFREGAEHPALAELLPRLPSRDTPAGQAPGPAFDPARLLPQGKGYYAYDGSLTAPPCTEGVLWLVMQQPQQVSASQLQALRRLFPSNARAVQALHGRVIRVSP